MMYQKIPIEQIDYNDQTFSLYHPSAQIIPWDEENPLYHPIWLQQITKNLYRIVDGFYIFQILLQHHPDRQINAYVFSADYPINQLIQHRIDKKIFENNLSLYAFGEILLRLQSKIVLDQQWQQKILKQLHYPGKVNDFLLIIEKLQENIFYLKQLTDIYLLKGKDLIAFNQFQKNDFKLLVDLFQGEILQGNKLNSLLTLITELLRGYNLSLEKIIQHPIIQKIPAQVPHNFKYQQIKKALLQLRYPNLTQFKQSWDQIIQQLKLTDKIKIIEDPSFENQSLEILLSAESKEELQIELQQLLKLSDNHLLDQLFQLVK